MEKNILLIEPDYKNKYPPLGLMKISTFHKQSGDKVLFYKGCNQELKQNKWDRIYISTLFTFYWAKTISTIKYYLQSVDNPKNIFVGGVMATLMKSKLEKEFDVTVVSGLLNEQGKLNIANDHLIDSLTPDYSIIDTVTNPILDYTYPTKDCYIAYSTRGCVNKCSFCAVPIIEPVFSNSLSIAHQVNAIKKQFGEKRDLLLMDNNVLASDCFPSIIEEIKSLGFAKGAKLSYKNGEKKVTVNRYVDFNQGIDARLLTVEKVKLLSEIAIKPIRIAFDDIKYKDIYIEKVRLAAEYRINVLSNYILFNYKDTPEDFYERLKINIDLNEEFENVGYSSRIWSFPMKFTPVKGEEAITRRHIGKHWNKKFLRGIQCILLSTHGVVGPKKDFFEAAFGENIVDFKEILSLPDDYIIYRKKNISNGNVEKWRNLIVGLNDIDKQFFYDTLFYHNRESQIPVTNKNLLELFSLYNELKRFLIYKTQIELYQ